MPEETVGYIELEWTCANCGTVNPGLQKKCKNCGAAMGESQQFNVPGQAELLKDQEKLKATERGADIHCGYCGARNPADAKKCVNCGGDLAEGKARAAGTVVGALHPGAPVDAPGAASVPAPQTAKPAAGMGMRIGCLLLIGLAVLGAIVMISLGAKTTDQNGIVQDTRWQRTVAIMALQPVQAQAWRDGIPSGVQVGACERRPRRMVDQPVAGADRICGTPYVVDQGSGTGKVVQDCRYQVYDDFCSYTTQEWQVVDRRVAQGNGLGLAWPALNVPAGQRLGDRSENFKVVFAANDKTYEYSPVSAQEYSRFQIGSKWLLKINTFGHITGVEPAK